MIVRKIIVFRRKQIKLHDLDFYTLAEYLSNLCPRLAFPIKIEKNVVHDFNIKVPTQFTS